MLDVGLTLPARAVPLVLLLDLFGSLRLLPEAVYRRLVLLLVSAVALAGLIGGTR